MIDWAIAAWIIDPTLTYNIVGPNYADIIWDNEPYPSESELISAYQDWLNGEKKAEIREVIIDMSEAEKSKHITNTPGKVFAYFQKANEMAQLEAASFTSEEEVDDFLDAISFEVVL